MLQKIYYNTSPLDDECTQRSKFRRSGKISSNQHNSTGPLHSIGTAEHGLLAWLHIVVESTTANSDEPYPSRSSLFAIELRLLMDKASRLSSGEIY